MYERCKPIIGKPSRVRRRVAYRIVEIIYRSVPHEFKNHPPSAVLEIAEHFRKVFPHLYPELAWYARNMAAGYTLKELRDCEIEFKNRAMTKRRPVMPKRYD